MRVPVAYLLALGFGAVVGATELIARYRDKPAAAVWNWPAALYMGVNALASGVLFYLLHSNRLTVPVNLFNGSKILDDLALAGFGAMALFRTSLFTLRVQDSNIAIGPAAVLQVILRVADRETDRERAGPRARKVKDIMRGVSFGPASVALTEHCTKLMQNVTDEERSDLDQEIAALRSKTDISDEAKSYILGLLLMNIVGEDVLAEAVEALGTRIRNPSEDKPEVLSRARELDREDLVPLTNICFALDSRTFADAEIARMVGVVETGDKAAPAAHVLWALLRLRGFFGAEIVSMAIGLVVSTKAGRPVGSESLSAAGFAGSASPASQAQAPSSPTSG
jgi:hypothetical protein